MSMSSGKKIISPLRKIDPSANDLHDVLKEIGDLEKHFAAKGVKIVIGADEAGRGPLAGPICGGAVAILVDELLSNAFGEEDLKLVRDSKKVSKAKHPKAREFITEGGFALFWAEAQRNADAINKDGIETCNELVISEAVEAVLAQLEASLGADEFRKMIERKEILVVVDGNKQIDLSRYQSLHVPQKAVIDADTFSRASAAASLIAKTYHDDIMRKLDEEFPGYGFAKHTGYGTKEHIEAIKRLGPSPCHRMSFLKKILGS